MRLGVFLALVATGLALECNVGNFVLQDGVITSKFLKSQPCAGMCSRSVLSSNNKDFVMLACQENEIAIWKYQQEQRSECSARELGDTCLCSESHCSDWKAEEKIIPLPEILDANTQPICYVGYYANNGTAITLNNGATTKCPAGQACAFISGAIGNTQLEAYICTGTSTCQQAIGTTDGTGTIQGDNVQMTCCSQADCRNIVTNTNINVPQTITTGSNNINCMQGAQLNYSPLGQYASLPCSGSCSSVSIKTYIGTGRNQQIALLDLFTCDPVAVCDSVNLNNGCGNLVLNQTSSLLRGCCCNTNNCIDPTQQPPVYPIKSLKCWTGIYIPQTGYQVGAEMVCNEKCGRIEVPMGTNTVKYMSCFPYSVCQGFGIGDGDQSYNPPMEEETTVTCCSSKDNCNINPYDASMIVPNVTALPTTNYPILCYGNIHLNGVPMTTGSYGMCNGECAMATFTTTVFGQQHNTTLYTCDPATMCRSAGITNGCAQINGTAVTACCCDDDSCFDPNRQFRGSTKCYTGIYVAEDNYLNGGETLCDGWCASLSTIVNNKNTTTYWCAPVKTCRQLALGMGGDQNCNSIPGANPPLTGCCCAEGNNCNLPANLQPNVTALPVRKEPPIVCYEAIHVNGNAMGNPGYRVCNGNCVSMTMGAKINGSAQSTTLYTCDSSSSCNAMGLRNGCGSVDGTVYSCCCDTDTCIDPTVNRSPDRTQTCFVGVNSPIVFAGTNVQCNGKCANMTTTIGGQPFTSYHCVPSSFCYAMGLDNYCDVANLDRSILGCCCDNSDSCNALGTNINASIPVAPPEAPIACWQGLHINGTTWTAGSGWTTCQGDCMVLSLNTSLNGGFVTASMYTCDPTSVCSALNMTNRCHPLEPGVFGCCCSDSGCIDPTKNPPKFPRGRPLTCYNGLVSGYNNLSAGAEQSCDGSCASLTSTVSGVNFTVFSCVPKTICSQLGLYDGCNTLQADRAITGCCCDNADNCNTVGFKVPPPAPREHDFPIVCFNGIFLNGKGVSVAGWQTCIGDCALVSFNTTYNNSNYQADFYTCDPAAVCHQLNLVNRCNSVEPGISGCCCDTDACLDPTRFPPKKPGPPLKCYVGIKTVQGLNTNIDVGSEVFCNGMCANVHGLVGAYNVSTYMCAPFDLCKSLELNNDQKQLPGDRFITGMCCDTGDNCNVRDPKINTTKPVAPPEYPVSCYSGIFVNRQLITSGGWMACNGDCALISLNSTYANGSSVVADLYTCDPTSVCRGLGLQNSCNTTLEDGLSGCCCDSNGCLDPTKRPPKRPGQLYCYVGIDSPSFQNVSTGAAVPCNGKCGDLQGNVAGYNVTVYACVDSAVCRGLNLYDDCTRIPGDREVTACCCDNYNYCNVGRRNPSITIPTPSPNTEFPISCYNGLNLNGNDISPPQWGVCNGDCASIQVSTVINGMMNNLTLYTCDPTSVCTALKTRNSCNNIEPGLYGCCCDTDGCINPKKNRSPANPLTCFVGVQSNYSPAFQLGIGSQVYCNGKCASLQGVVGGYNTTTFHCVDNSICKYLALDNACSSVSPNDREVSACCCDSGNACNVAQAGVTMTVPPLQNSTEPFVACYSGIWLNGNKLTPGSYQACQGDCASVQLNTSLAGVSHTATLYTCDPATVCRSLNVSNSCGMLEPGLKGCCCDSDACIDPTKNRSPDISLNCYVGVYNGQTNVSIGDSVLCQAGNKCMSIASSLNGKPMKVYNCVKNTICTGLGLDNSCNSVPGDKDLTACCCDGSNLCNVGTETVGTNIPQLNYTGNPIACWSGLYVNGKGLGQAQWSSCNGDCASIQFTTMISGVNNTATLYTCDPATVCQQLGINNKCGTLDGVPGLTGCCCSSDACMDSTSIYPKSQQMTCYAGIVSNYSSNPGGIMAGAPVRCNGRCATLTSTVAGYGFTAYQCIPTSICQTLGIDGTCNSIYYDRDIYGCCCSNKDYCNLQGTGISPPPFPSYNEPVIACYNGLWVNNAVVGSGSFQGCYGKCASITLNTTLSGQPQYATLYTCDPSTVCTQLNLTNSCGSPEPGVTGCCCDSDACIDPNYSRFPGRQLTCYVGVYNGATNQSMGADSTCDGRCASVQTKVNNIKYKAYFCLNTRQTEALGVDNGCVSLPADPEIRACVCDGSNNCNVLPDEPVLQNPINTTYNGAPIACWNGVYVNNQSLGSVGWNGCMGQCASVQWQTTYMSNKHTLTLYTCDPAAACLALGLSNSCADLDAVPGLTGCCCDSDACMDSTSIYPKSRSVQCFVGLVSNYSNSPNGLMAGGSVNCQGQCASLNGIVNGFNVTTYQCLDSSICKYALNGAASGCNALPGDPQINGCCCSDSDFCNIKGTNIQPPPVSNFTEPPIACYNGLWIDNSSVTAGRYLTCNGQCASVAITTSFQGALHTATVYTCDPSYVCREMNMTNSCYVPETGVKGCCCNSDACIDPSKNRSPDINLNCYVGVYNGATGIAIGDSVLCNGGKKCLSLSTTMKGNLYKVYQCVNPAICNGMRPPLDNVCSNNTAWDSDVSACCCDNGNLCNVGTESVGTNIPQLNFTGNPIACWSGLYLNGKSISGGSWSSCNGDCAAIQLNTSLSSQTNSLTLYTCDPVTVCQQLGIVNTCGNLDQVPGLTGCCCDSDACMDSTSIYPKSRSVLCYVGVTASNYISPANPAGVIAGDSVACTGQCSWLSGNVGGQNVTSYQCVDRSICKYALNGTASGCGALNGDSQINGCCCSDSDFCSIKTTQIPQPDAKNFTEPPLACYGGLWIDNALVAGGGYSACFGKCASVTLNTTYAGQSHSATIYTCDPAAVCAGLNVTNQCTTLPNETGVSGCCCDSDACIDPNFSRYPGRSLSCYVGVYNQANNSSMGISTSCIGGKCGSIETSINNWKYKAYFCLNPQQTETLGVDHGCRSVVTDREITACVCDDSDNCNVKSGEYIAPNAPNVTIPGAGVTPIACWSGLYVNGTALGNDGWSGCLGNCAVIQFNTTAAPSGQAPQNHILTLYTCDPAAACGALGINNACVQNVDAIPGMTGCCCNFDGCVTKNSIYPIANPAATTKPSGSTTAVSTMFAMILTAVYTVLRHT